MIIKDLRLLGDIRLVLSAEALFRHFNESGQYLTFAILLRQQQITEGMALLAFAHFASFLVYQRVMTEAACASGVGAFDFPELKDMNLPLPAEAKARRIVALVYRLLHHFFAKRSRAVSLIAHRLTPDRVACLKSFPYVEVDVYDAINSTWKDCNTAALNSEPDYRDLLVKLSARHKAEVP